MVNVVSLIDEVRSLKLMESFFPPNISDLEQINDLLEDAPPRAVLEIGSGWSTILFASIARQMEPKLGYRFIIVSLDAAQKWSDEVQSALRQLGLDDYVQLQVSRPVWREYDGQIVAQFEDFPFIQADFIYLDGPDPGQVSGDFYANEFATTVPLERTFPVPMLVDLCLHENFMLPKTRIVVDGRGLNARFLQRTFRREWIYKYDAAKDQHHFFLDEPGLRETFRPATR